MTEIQNSKPVYDIEERTFQFVKAARHFVKSLPKTMGNIEDGKQLIKVSGSIGANYREANKSLRKKDLVMRIKTSRKKATENAYWLILIHEKNNLKNADEALRLMQETKELKKFSHQFWKYQNDQTLLSIVLVIEIRNSFVM